MVRGVCLPERGCERMAWKHDDECYGYGQVETEERVGTVECNRYGEERGRWGGVIKMKDGMHEYDVIKGLESDEVEK